MKPLSVEGFMLKKLSVSESDQYITGIVLGSVFLFLSLCLVMNIFKCRIFRRKFTVREKLMDKNIYYI